MLKTIRSETCGVTFSIPDHLPDNPDAWVREAESIVMQMMHPFRNFLFMFVNGLVSTKLVVFEMKYNDFLFLRRMLIKFVVEKWKKNMPYIFEIHFSRRNGTYRYSEIEERP